jgi:hypothetical protein
MRVLLEYDAADELPVEKAEFLEAPFNIEDEDNRVFEGANSAARDPSSTDGFAE